MQKILTITSSNFEEEVIQSNKPILLDFWAPWCGPCRMIAPVLEEIAVEQDAVKIGKINVDDHGDLAVKFDVKSIPLLVLVKNGEVIEKSLGAKPKDGILKMLESVKN